MFQSEIKRKRGGQPGNRNARKHGFYSNVLAPDDKLYLKVYYNIALPADAGEQFIREMEKGVEKSE